ncbi:PrgI family protein [Robertmurraya yapensis]|uniref:PrgI family protein n=1 Tax=Bacillus yapensis TaxID=2492960 RepID=A0A3S0I957_9BACI|nr:PrgI family protein [Bacillus yapensis]RTR28133.1 PrgI family protein [Bacillus yapensis]TKS94376.1 PrgI family protein [Bacillus yapensis]
MKTRMPFDTETERKVIKFMSWRQSLYALVGGLLYLSIGSEILFAGMPFITTIVVLALLIPITIPFVIFGFYQDKETNLFYDHYLWFRFNHKKKQAGIWRK